jgi:hypothetical protein
MSAATLAGLGSLYPRYNESLAVKTFDAIVVAITRNNNNFKTHNLYFL